MAKFRSKLKRHTKGQKWTKGLSSTLNPKNMRNRLKAKSRFFQPVLSEAIKLRQNLDENKLTPAVLSEHDTLMSFFQKDDMQTVSDIVSKLELENADDNMSVSNSYAESTGTCLTFASNYSTCSNQSFKSFLTGFRGDSEAQKEMLAVLSALTDIIKERGGEGCSEEYYMLLLEIIEANRGATETAAAVALLSICIKSVPDNFLRKNFSKTAEILFRLLENCTNTDLPAGLKLAINCMSTLLRAQEFSKWNYSFNLRYIDILLMFTVHTKAKIRKAAQHSVAAIMHGSSFMLQKEESVNLSEPKEMVASDKLQVGFHPAGSRILTFCLNHLKPDFITNSQTMVLYTLELLLLTISRFKAEDIKTISETLLSIMTTPNILLRAKSMQIFHNLFVSRTSNVTATLCYKLIYALYDYRPDTSDQRQSLAWVTVLKEGYIHLSLLDLNLCISSLPKFCENCIIDLWSSGGSEIISGVYYSLKDVLTECVKLACKSDDLGEMYSTNIAKIIEIISKSLSSPFNDIAKHAILLFSTLVEATSPYYNKILVPSISTICSRYDTSGPLQVQIEHSIIAAIKSLGPELVLEAIPLVNTNDEILIERTWILPLLREGITGSTFEFFANYILPLASKCNKIWQECKNKDMMSTSHTYELLCCQLWGLFPGFCKKPKDIERFNLIAKTLGMALDENPEYHAPILDGFIELISEGDEAVNRELNKYSKNFLPRLFNIYIKKPNGTYEANIREKTIVVIKLFLSIFTHSVLQELFHVAFNKLKSIRADSFESDALQDVCSSLVIYLTKDKIRTFFEEFIVPVLKSDKNNIVAKNAQNLKRQQQKAYELLKNILTQDQKECILFFEKNSSAIQKLLFQVLNSSCAICQASRLKCLQILIDSKKDNPSKNKLIVKVIPEVILNFKNVATKNENIAQELLTLFGRFYQEIENLDEYLDILLAGLGGDEVLITNTILALRHIIYCFGTNLKTKALEFILQQITSCLSTKCRPQAEAAIVFLITFVKVLPSQFTAVYMDGIMKSLSSMAPDTKKYCRIQIGYLLKKLCKKFTAEDIIKLVPGNDEVTHRRLKKLRKELKREGRNVKNSKGTEESEDETDNLEKKSKTIDDILADSDSEDFDSEENEDKNFKKPAKNVNSGNLYIQEGAEEIVDFTDTKSVANILTKKKAIEMQSSKNKKKDINRGFKTSQDGRLIISEDNFHSQSDDDEIEGKLGTETQLHKDSSDEDYNLSSNQTRKRGMVKTKNKNSKYTEGGKGIHRLVGISKTNKKKTTISKKVKGDVKKKEKLDPYAYIALSRNILNKRKKTHKINKKA